MQCRCSLYTSDASVQLQGKQHSGGTDCEHLIILADFTPKGSAAAAPAFAPAPPWPCTNTLGCSGHLCIAQSSQC